MKTKCDTCNTMIEEKELTSAYPFKGKACKTCRKTIHKIGGHI